MPVTSKLLSKKIGKYIKYTVFATNILAIIFLLLSILAWFAVPSKAKLIAYLGLGFPFILCANVGYLILWLIFWRWRYALIQLVVIICCWYPVSATFPVNFRSKNLPEEKIKILSYNVRSFNWMKGEDARKNPIFDYVLDSNADIVCFQEFTIGKKSNKNDLVSEKEFNEIMKDYPYYAIVEIGKPKSSHKYGLACYSKYPILEAESIPIGSEYNGSAMLTLDIEGRKVSLVINHLESNGFTSEDRALYREFLRTRDRESFDEMAHSLQAKLGSAYNVREKQVDIIRQWIDKQKTDATIICGDFNDTPISYTYHTLKGSDFVDAYANTGFGYGLTYHENYFWVRIDFIMHSKTFQSYNCTVDRVKYSDHYPIWSYLSFK